MLRTTVAAFAAGVGGADAVTVLPFDSPLGEPDAFGRRIARNISHLLIDESHVGAVADPAGGSYAVEKLTDDLAAAAWEELGRIEADGVEALDEPDRRRSSPRATPRCDPRKRPITGLTEFPNLAEIAARARAGADERRRTPLRRRLRGAARRARRRARSSWPRMGTVAAAHRPRRRSPPTCSPPAASPVEQAGPTDGVEPCSRRTTASRSSAWPAPTRRTPSGAPPLVAALREAGARHVIVAGTGRTTRRRRRRARWASTRWPSCAGRGRSWRERPGELRRAAAGPARPPASGRGAGPRTGRALAEPRGHRDPAGRTAPRTSRVSTRSTPGPG